MITSRATLDAPADTAQRLQRCWRPTAVNWEPAKVAGRPADTCKPCSSNAATTEKTSLPRGYTALDGLSRPIAT